MPRLASCRALTEDEQVTIRKRFAEGAPVRTLVKEFGVTPYFIHKAIKAGVPIGSRGGYAGEQQG